MHDEVHLVAHQVTRGAKGEKRRRYMRDCCSMALVEQLIVPLLQMCRGAAAVDTERSCEVRLRLGRHARIEAHIRALAVPTLQRTPC